MEDLYQRVSQYATPFLKAIYDYHSSDVLRWGIHFVHDGVGASVVYPGFVLNGTRTLDDEQSHTTPGLQQQNDSIASMRTDASSDGCEWLQYANPKTDKDESIGTASMLDKCQSVSFVSGASSQPQSIRLYNPVKTAWFREQALNPHEMQFTGPHRCPLTDRLIITIGRSIYDDVTGQLIGTVKADIPFERIGAILDGYRKFGSTAIGLARWDDGVMSAYAPVPDTFPIGSTVADFPDLQTDLTLFHQLKDQVMKDYHGNHPQRGGEFSLQVGRIVVSIHPIPSPPEVFDPEYKPHFLMITALDESEGYAPVDAANEEIDKEVQSLEIQILVVCCVVMIIVCLLIYVVSLFMTLPLQWINKVGDSILASFASSSRTNTGASPIDSLPWFCRYAPRNEIKYLVNEFHQMIQQFSGRGTAKIFKRQLFEVENPFVLHENFQKLYDSRQGMKINGSLKTLRRSSISSLSTGDVGIVPLVRILKDVAASEAENDDGTRPEMSPQSSTKERRRPSVSDPEIRYALSESIRKHNGPACRHGPMTASGLGGGLSGAAAAAGGGATGGGTTDSRNLDSVGHESVTIGKERKGVVRTHLFWWIVGMITFPLGVTLLSVAVYVSWSILTSFAKHIDTIRDLFVGFERFSLGYTAEFRAWYVSEVLNGAVRDLHILQYFSGWVYAGAIGVSGAFPQVDTDGELCKTIPPGEPCPFRTSSAVCDCSWNDEWSGSRNGDQVCTRADQESNGGNHDGSQTSRLLQRVFFEGLSEDAYPNGDRNFTSYPDVATSPANTSFWADTSRLPGSSTDGNSPTIGWDTTSDRVSGLSVLSVIQLPLYNYGNYRKGDSMRTRGLEMGYEADGMYGGYRGCQNTHPYVASFQSTIENGGALYDPTLCPRGKYGFDIRCTHWYSKMKNNTAIGVHEQQSGSTGTTPGGNGVLSIAPPALLDPSTGRYGMTVSLPFATGIPTNPFTGGIKGDIPLERLAYKLGPEGTFVENDSAVFLISSSRDPTGADVVIGPDFDITEGKTLSIEDMFFRGLDVCEHVFEFTSNCARRSELGSIVATMKSGGDGRSKFTRTGLDGSKEVVNVGYWPVVVETRSQTNPADLTDSGVTTIEMAPFSVGLYQTERGLRQQFVRMENVVGRAARNSLVIMMSIVFVSIAVVIFISAQTTISVTVPVAVLLRLVKKVNR